MISIAITVCNEHKELKSLLDFLEENALHDQYEVIIQIDKNNYTEDVIGVIVNRGIKHYFYPLNNDFASFKNNLFKECSGDYIFQLDADEIPNMELIRNLPEIIETNSNIDLFLVPRDNRVEGLTQEHVKKWGWKVDNLGRINFPDYQTRIYKNTPDIKWVNKVHERIEGFKTYTSLPDGYFLHHNKTIEKQEKQNNYYDTL